MVRWEGRSFVVSYMIEATVEVSLVDCFDFFG